jgi:hypothetical protein
MVGTLVVAHWANAWFANAKRDSKFKVYIERVLQRIFFIGNIFSESMNT